MRLVRRAEVEAVVVHYLPFLGLSDWEWTLTMDMGKSGDCVAAVLAQPHERSFTLSFAPRVFADSAEKNRRVSLNATVLHELLHVAIWPLMMGACEAKDSEGLSLMREVIEEPMVDSMSRVLARYLPRPRPRPPKRKT